MALFWMVSRSHCSRASCTTQPHYGGGYIKADISHLTKPGTNVLALNIQGYAGAAWRATLLEYDRVGQRSPPAEAKRSIIACSAFLRSPTGERKNAEQMKESTLLPQAILTSPP